MGEPNFVIVDQKTERRTAIVLKQTIIGRNPNFHIHVNDISV